MCRICWVVVVMLVLLSSGMAYKFIIQGSTVASSDGRLSILLEEGERDLVLAEMRGFLEAVQQITTGISDGDMETVSKAARKVGAAAQQAVPGSLVGKLPLDFKKLGFDTHTRFDQLALDAEQLGDEGHALAQLTTLMQNCVGCHAGYRIDSMKQ